MGKAKDERLKKHRKLARILNAAVKYDHEGCHICGHKPIGNEFFPIGLIGRRMIAVCGPHIDSLDVSVAIQYHRETKGQSNAG